MLHLVGDLFELNVKLRCQKFKILHLPRQNVFLFSRTTGNNSSHLLNLYVGSVPPVWWSRVENMSLAYSNDACSDTATHSVLTQYVYIHMCPCYCSEMWRLAEQVACVLRTAFLMKTRAHSPVRTIIYQTGSVRIT